MGLIIKLQRQHVGLLLSERDFDVNAARNSLKYVFFFFSCHMLWSVSSWSSLYKHKELAKCKSFNPHPPITIHPEWLSARPAGRPQSTWDTDVLTAAHLPPAAVAYTHKQHCIRLMCVCVVGGGGGLRRGSYWEAFEGCISVGWMNISGYLLSSEGAALLPRRSLTWE